MQLKKTTISGVFNSNNHKFDKLLEIKFLEKFLNFLNKVVGTSNNYKEEFYYKDDANTITIKAKKRKLK